MARRPAGTAAISSASELGINIAAPTEGTTRVATSMTKDIAPPQPSEPSMKTTSPAKKIRRWP
jgi:hypothetical protein